LGFRCTEKESAVWKKVPDPQNPGHFVDATPIEVIDGQTSASINARLADGTTIFLTVQIVEIARIEGRLDASGQQMYNVDANGQIRVVPPRSEGGMA
jgi:hypothetical protein